MAKRVVCPSMFCRSTNCVPIPSNGGKKYSVGKGAIMGAAGRLFLGPVAGMVGVASGFNRKAERPKFVCQKCGRIFSI